LGLGHVNQTNQVRPQIAAVGRACGDHLLAGQALVRVKPAKHRHLLLNEVGVQRQGHQLIVVGRRKMICYLARPIQPDLAYLEMPATPDGLCVLSQDGKAAIAARGRPTFDVNHTVHAKQKDLNRSLLKELELTPEWSTAELPETKIPLRERLSQLVEVRGTQRLEEHEPSPVVTLQMSPDCSFPT
jgi:hypothetical protein